MKFGTNRGKPARAFPLVVFCRFAAVPYRQAEAARVSSLWPDVLLGLQSAQTPQNGLRPGHLRDPLLLPVLSLQVAHRGELPQAPAVGAQHQVGEAKVRRRAADAPASRKRGSRLTIAALNPTTI